MGNILCSSLNHTTLRPAEVQCFLAVLLNFWLLPMKAEISGKNVR